MSKYIIEIAKEYEEYFKGVLICGIADGKFAVDVIAVEDLEELNCDYINENFGELQDEAYQRGLEDAWEAAKKIFGYEIDGGIPIDKIGRVFGYSENETFCTADIIRHNTASEAIAKLKAYEDKQKDRIEVGDEVEWDGDKYVVTYLNYDIETSEITDYDLLAYDGSVVDHVKKCAFTKTGKHYDIASILEAMRTHD